MTVTNTTARNQYTATAGQTVFAYTFEVYNKNDLVVLQNDTTLAEGTNYTVSGVGSDSGGNITLTVGATAGDIITVYRDMALERLTDYQNSGDFLAAEVNEDFDRLWLAVQQGAVDSDRAIVKPVTDLDSISTTLPSSSDRANSFLTFDGSGAVTVTSSGDPSTPSTIYRQQFTGDGSTTAFSLTVAPGGVGQSVQVFIDGVYQEISTFSISGSTLNFSEAPPLNSSIEYVAFKVGEIGSTDASLVTYIPAGTGAVGTTVQAKLRESVSVKDFGAVGDGVTDDAAAINAAALAVYNQGGGTLLFPKTTASYGINDDIILYDNTRVVCEGWVKRIGTGGVYDAVFVNQAGADNIYFETPLIDCNNQLGMNGIIFRRNGTNMVVNGGIIKNCKHEVGVKLGGRALNIEAGANIAENGLKATRVTGVSIIDSYNGISLSGGDNQEEAGCVISNISMENVDIPFTLFGNSAGYPHDGDSMSHMVSNVVGINCGKSSVYPNAAALICSDRGSNVMFSNVYFSNTAAYGATNALYYGDAHNIHMRNFIYDGDSVYGYVGFGWQETASPVDSGYNTSDSSFDFVHNGNISTDIISVSSATTTRIQNVFFNIKTNTLTNDRPFTSLLSGNANVHVNIFNKAQNAEMIGRASEVNHAYTFTSIAGKTAYPRIFTLFDVNGSDYDITVSTAGKLLINGTVVGTQT